jgi:hypothetical protein
MLGRHAALFFFAWLACVQTRIGIAQAQANDEVPDPHALAVHAFVSQGFVVSTDNNYLAESKHGSFELTEVGINFTKPLTDELRVGIQLFARDLGPLGNYEAQLDWFYIDYRWADWLGFRAGRVKLPFGLYNEINDVDSARPFVLLPQSVYPTQQRDYLLAQTGVELYGYIDLKKAGALDYRLYGGTAFVGDDVVDAPPNSPIQIAEVNTPYIAGARLLWETPLPGLRMGGSAQLLQLDLDVFANPTLVAQLQQVGRLPADFDGAVDAKIPAFLWVGSVEYVINDLIVAVEYSRWDLGLESKVPVIVPEQDIVSERMYALAAYRVTPWFQPGAYYSLYFQDVSDRDRRSKRQHDTALTARFDINEYWLVKLEGHYMHGTAALTSRLNDGRPLAQLEPDWFVFIAKTTAYF